MEGNKKKEKEQKEEKGLHSKYLAKGYLFK
jgi:hypothetical protein